MTEKPEQYSLPVLISDATGIAAWSEQTWPIKPRSGMRLSPRIGCSSLRLRKSEPGYQADWHVAGDPTLIVIRGGRLKLILQDGSHRIFGPGEAFIAADNVPDGQDFDPSAHGHRAEVVGDEALEAIHIKLMNAPG